MKELDIKCFRIDKDEGIHRIDLETRKAFFANHHFILTADGPSKVIGVIEGEKTYFVGDRVLIEGDCLEYIAPGITQDGSGTIKGINEDDTDHYYIVQMDNGESGSVSSSKITKILRR